MMEPAAHWQRQFEHHQVPASLAGPIEEMPKKGLKKAPPLGERNVESWSALEFSADQLKKWRPGGVIYAATGSRR